MPNTVSLNFAGDADDLEKTFVGVGSAADKVGTDFQSVEGKAKSFGSAANGVGGAVGGMEQKFSGTADLLDGLGGAFGLPTEGATGLMRSFGDLSGGFEVVQGFLTTGVGKIKAFGAAVLQSSAVTRVWTGVQAAFNAVMAINPVILIVAALALLVGGLILAYKKSETFRDIVDGAFTRVKEIASDVVDFFVSIPQKIGAVGGAILDVIVWPYKTAFNLIAKLWNNTVGKLQFEIPSWVPGLGGKGFSMPNLPEFHAGGIVPGAPGSEVPVVARVGERVGAPGRDSGPLEVRVFLDGREIHQSLLRLQRQSGDLGLR